MDKNEQQQEGTQNQKPAAEPQKKEPEWFTPRERWPYAGETVTFVTELGLTYHGMSVSISPLPRNHPNASPVGAVTTLFATESAGNDPVEYFSMYQVEKWCKSEPIPMRRQIGLLTGEQRADLGLMGQLFASYLFLRADEKAKENQVFGRVTIGSTFHYQEADKKHSWETDLVLDTRNGPVYVRFVEHEGRDQIDAQISDRGLHSAQEYSYKLVGQACEEILRSIIQNM